MFDRKWSFPDSQHSFSNPVVFCGFALYIKRLCFWARYLFLFVCGFLVWTRIRSELFFECWPEANILTHRAPQSWGVPQQRERENYQHRFVQLFSKIGKVIRSAQTWALSEEPPAESMCENSKLIIFSMNNFLTTSCPFLRFLKTLTI